MAVPSISYALRCQISICFDVMAKQGSRNSYLKNFHFRKMICTSAVSEFVDEQKRKLKCIFDQSVVPFLLNGFTCFAGHRKTWLSTRDPLDGRKL